MKHLLIWGAGDQGTVTLDCALAMKRYDMIDFLDMKEKGHRSIPGYAVYEEEKVNLSGFLRSYNEAIVAVGSNDLREAKTSRLMSLGIPLATVIHPTAVISPFSHISRGCAVLARAVVNPNAHVGHHWGFCKYLPRCFHGGAYKDRQKVVSGNRIHDHG